MEVSESRDSWLEQETENSAGKRAPPASSSEETGKFIWSILRLARVNVQRKKRVERAASLQASRRASQVWHMCLERSPRP